MKASTLLLKLVLRYGFSLQTQFSLPGIHVAVKIVDESLSRPLRRARRKELLLLHAASVAKRCQVIKTPRAKGQEY